MLCELYQKKVLPFISLSTFRDHHYRYFQNKFYTLSTIIASATSSKAFISSLRTHLKFKQQPSPISCVDDSATLIFKPNLKQAKKLESLREGAIIVIIIIITIIIIMANRYSKECNSSLEHSRGI